MIVTDVMISTVIMAMSFAAGSGIYYIISEEEDGKKQAALGEGLSTLINFILFIWLSKLIVNFPQFISEPLTILAYPGGSQTFYLAFLLNSVLYVYRYRTKKIDTREQLVTFSMVFLMSSIIYELIQFVWNENESSFGYLLLLSFLLIILLIMQDKMKSDFLTMTLITMWSAGIFLLLVFFPVVTVFGYIIRPWFVVLFLIIGNSTIFLTSNEGEEMNGY